MDSYSIEILSDGKTTGLAAHGCNSPEMIYLRILSTAYDLSKKFDPSNSDYLGTVLEDCCDRNNVKIKQILTKEGGNHGS